MRRAMLEINSIHFLIGTLIASILFLNWNSNRVRHLLFFLRLRGYSNIPASLAGTSICGSQYIYKSIRGRKASEIKVICIPVAERLAGA